MCLSISQLQEQRYQRDGYYDFTEYGNRARAIVKQNYTWEKIIGEYEGLFLNED